MLKTRFMHYLAAGAAVLVVTGANAQTFVESEPNDSKAAANNVLMGTGNFTAIQGNSTSSTGAGLDYFRVQTTGDALGIYRHRLVLTTQGTAGHTATIRGLSQTGAAFGPWDGSTVGTPTATEVAAQTGSTATTPPRFVQWYGFGKREQIDYRVTGTSSTSADYIASYERMTITPRDIGDYEMGTITINFVGQTTLDTDIWVYDANLNPIRGYGSDDESIHNGGAGTTLQSRLRRDYGLGRYYIAVGRFNLALDQGSPCDDDFRTGSMLEYPNAVLSSSSATTTTLASFQMIDANGTTDIVGDAFGPYDVNWYCFDVVPEPTSMVALGAGLLALAARRRRK
ncbi:MAG: PEP-CTERM sorting domain-containing protein [Armatimonadetes bacterium]|nr:PEP-CTERM sorting domain-containing protein [Armatimonadota bacterium]